MYYLSLCLHARHVVMQHRDRLCWHFCVLAAAHCSVYEMHVCANDCQSIAPMGHSPCHAVNLTATQCWCDVCLPLPVHRHVLTRLYCSRIHQSDTLDTGGTTLDYSITTYQNRHQALACYWYAALFHFVTIQQHPYSSGQAS